MNTVAHNRNESVDFIKGVAILSVILLHSTPHHVFFQIAWIGQAVPLFLLITAYLTYSSFQKGKTMEEYFSKRSILKMLKRIFLPFFIITVVQIIISYLFNSNFSFISVLADGGIGPGSYYPWLYLQCWIFLPFIIKAIDKLSILKSSVLFLSICIVFELVSSITQIDAHLYRLLFYRYLFLLYLGCLLKKQDWRIDIKILVFAAIGLLFSSLEIYANINFEPYFVRQWEGYHWITAFYPVLIFLILSHIHTYIHTDRQTETIHIVRKFFLRNIFMPNVCI